VRLTPDNLQLVLQHCSGGTLESYCKQHRVSEDLACFFFHQLVAVLEHLHTSKIAYRDMKLQNVLLRSKPSRSSPPRLVLCDLGTAKTWTGQQYKCETFVGTPGEWSKPEKGAKCGLVAVRAQQLHSTRSVQALLFLLL
jgi:serine/threonine protein kinase